MLRLPSFLAVLAILPILSFSGSAMAQETAKEVVLPEDSAYVRPVGDHLELDGKRVRYWGFIGFIAGPAKFKSTDAPDVKEKAVADRHADIDMMVKRIDDLGFNLIRSWEGGFDNGNENLSNFIQQQDYTPGDGSNADMVAYYFNKLDKLGIKIWMSSTNALGAVSPEDVDVIDDPKTAEEWKAAVAALQEKDKGKFKLRSDPGEMVIFTDERTEKIAINRYLKFANFRNKYKTDIDPAGLRIGDDPQVVVWELTNEQFPFRRFFNGHWQNLPPFFKNQLLAKWNDFLKNKYGSDEKLTAAWRTLLPGESLEAGTILLAPLAKPIAAEAALNDTNPEVIKRMQVVSSKFSRDDFVLARGEDVVQFFTELMIAHKKRFSDAIKAGGKSCKLSPCVWDSGNPYQIQSSYMFQQADAVSTCTYVKGMGYDKQDRRYPFWSNLDSSPRLCWDVPWVEQSTAPDKPTFIYETQIDTRTKYRAEYPMRIAAAAAIQGWDIVCWHAYSGGQSASVENPFVRPLAIWHDYLEYSSDEVQLSAMLAAGEVFKHGLLDEAPKPTTMIFGRRSLYDPKSMDYGSSFGDEGRRIIPTMYRYGLRIKIDPTREDDAIEGPSIRQGVYEPNPTGPSKQIQYDYVKGQLTFDAPGVAGYVGFFAQHGNKTIAFESNDVRFTDIKIENPDKIPFPVRDDEQYLSLMLVSSDGLPLVDTKRAVISAVSTSFNTGYALDLTKGSKGMRRDGPDDSGVKEFNGAWPSEAGKLPVQVARVGVMVAAQEIDGMDYTFYDFSMNKIEEGKIEGGRLEIPADKAVFYTVLTRP